MDYGMFSMPLRPPGGDVTKEYHQDVETFVLGDKLGYSEGWMGSTLLSLGSQFRHLIYFVLVFLQELNKFV